jgi:hypothetical protein
MQHLLFTYLNNYSTLSQFKTLDLHSIKIFRFLRQADISWLRTLLSLLTIPKTGRHLSVKDTPEPPNTTSKAAPHPLSSCSGPTDLLSHSFAREQIADRTVVLIHCIATKKVNYHVLSYLYAAKYRTTGLFPNPSLVSTSKNNTSNDARVKEEACQSVRC